MASAAFPSRRPATNLRKLGGSLTVTAPGVEPRGRELGLEEIEALLDPTEVLLAERESRGAADCGPLDATPHSRPMPTQASALLQDAPPTVTRAEMPLAAVGNLRPFQFEPFGDEPDHSPLDSVANIELPLSVELGHGEVSCSQHPGSGAVLVLKQTPNEPVDLLVNGRRIARGEILVLDDKFCVRITELTPRGERSEETGKTRSADVMTGEVIPDDRG